MTWSVYILQCGDGTLYTGITRDVKKRLAMHEEGRGARYTRGRGPLTLLYTESHATRSAATKREMAIKAMTREEKRTLLE